MTPPLERALRDAVRGDVRFDAKSRALHANDASAYRGVPAGVVVPRDADDVAAAVAACAARGAPILARGAGTSLAGQAVSEGAVVLDLRRLDRIVALDPQSRTAVVEPGVVLDALRAAAAPHGLTFGADPATHDRCTLGGMIGNDACGVRSIAHGRTSHQVEELLVLTSSGGRVRVGAGGACDGEGGASLRDALLAFRDRHADGIRASFPALRRRVSGYALDALLPENGTHVARSLVGSEGTLAIVLEATVRLVEPPRAVALLVLGLADVLAAADAVPALLAHAPVGLEGMDRALLREDRPLRGALRPPRVPSGGALLLVELAGATAREALERARAAAAAVPHADALVVEDASHARALWSLREAGVGTTTTLPDGRLAWPGWEDAAVPPERLADYLRGFDALLRRHGLRTTLYGHFGEGCVHARMDFELSTAAGAAAYERFLEQAADLVVAHGGSLSGEHGDGRARSALLARMYGDRIVAAFGELERIWDPRGLLNPGVIVDPASPRDALRVAGLADLGPRPTFAFAQDGGSLLRATLRCVGVGKCLKTRGGTMCPSYMVTRDEQHSTRGRARLLFEALSGGARREGVPVLTGGHDEAAVREALDLCLSCKACQSECPTGVDVAKWKAEFMARHHATRPRPRAALAAARVAEWAALARARPRLARSALAWRPVEWLVARAAGLTTRRPLPRPAREPWDAWLRARPAPPASPDRARVVLLADTFTRTFAPGRGRAAVALLEAHGFDVVVPLDAPCCGRPLFEWGLLDQARAQLAGLVDALSAPGMAGAPITAPEPACVSVLRDELPDLLASDPRAAQVARRARFFSEVAAALPACDAGQGRRAVLHAHCHEQALLGTESAATALARAGWQVETLDAGCCGMAGAFGMLDDRVDVSRAVGERVLLPRARALAPGDVLVADGWSCAQQVALEAGARTLHLAEALRGGA